VATIARKLAVGRPQVVDSHSPLNSFAVVFEDDGETGYLYGLDRARPDAILDALFIYNVGQFTASPRPSRLTIAWSADGLKAVLSLDGTPHGVFDFALKRAYCRANFPPPNAAWTAHDHLWDESVARLPQ
jgi:hypothetical protein